MTGASCVGTADEMKTTLAYGMSGVANNLLPTLIAESAGDGSISKTTQTEYDAIGNPVRVDGPLAGAADTVLTRYDVMRQVIGVVSPDPDGATDPLKHRAVRYIYNLDGQLMKVELGTVNSQSDADWQAMSVLQSITTTYDSTGRKTLVSQVGGGTTQTIAQYSYDAEGRLACEAVRMNSDAFSQLPASACILGTEGSVGPDRIHRFAYDDANRIMQVQAGAGTSVQRNELTRTYTANGLAQTITDAKGNLTSYEYDGFDRLSKTRFPSKSAPGQSSSSDFEQLSYDPSSNVIAKRRRDGQVIGFTPDALNRVSVKDLPGGNAEDIYFSYDHQGHLLSARQGGPNGAGITSSYDALARKRSTTIFGRSLTYDYDPAGNRTRITYPDGFYASYEFNSASELTVVRDSTGATLATYAYDNLGHPKTLTSGDGVNTLYAYDGIGRLNALSFNFTGTEHDNSLSFTHSPASQTITRTQTNEARYGWRPVSITSVSSQANGLNQLTQVGSASADYDSLGNLLNGATGPSSAWTFGYDVENQLRSATLGDSTISMDYDPFGMLHAVTINGDRNELLYDGPNMVAEYSSTGALLHRYVHGAGLDAPLGWYEGTTTATRRYFHADERGSIIAITRDDGAVRNIINYSPYGEAANAAVSRFGYTGQTWLASPGLYYYKSRMYSPVLGRFLQTDPAEYSDDLNLYAYVGNNPIGAIDPTGQYKCEGTPEQCQAVAEALERLKELESKLKRGSKEQKRLESVLEFYGDAGEENGVDVKFSQNVPLGATETLPNKRVEVRLSVTFHTVGRGYKGNMKTHQSGVIAHEGSHGVDQKDWGRNPLTMGEELQSDRTAYDLQSLLYKALRETDGLRGLWDPAWPQNTAEKSRQQAVERGAQESLRYWCSGAGAQRCQ
jgi:RHS repeat-associated protein